MKRKKTEVDRMVEKGYDLSRWATREEIVAEMEYIKRMIGVGAWGEYTKSSVRWKGHKHFMALNAALAEWDNRTTNE